MEFALNTAKSDATKTSPFELLYGVKPCDEFSVESSNLPSSDEFVKRRERIRKDACDALAMAQVRMAHYYDLKRTDKTMPSHVYIRMVKGINRGYRLPGGTSLSVIKEGPFKVLRKVGQLAYELELPPHIKIHPVISVIHLEPFLPDPYHQTPPKPGPILVGEEEEFTVNRLVDHELRNKVIFYRVRWQGYEATEDTWEPGPYLETKVPALVRRYQREHRNVRSTSLFSLLKSPWHKSDI